MDKIEVDLDVAKKGQLNESFLSMFGGALQILFKRLFGNALPLPVTIKGTPSQIEAFSRTLASEKAYADAFLKYGLDNPTTYKTKSVLDGAVSGFEKVTGIKWPFK